MGIKPKWNLTPDLLKMPYEECVENKLEECQYVPGESIHWHPRGGSHYSQVSTFKLIFHKGKKTWPSFLC